MEKKSLRKILQNVKRKNRGITLIALVITIVILIILATVTINFAFGENGLIRSAESARDFYANDTVYTEESIGNVESYIDGILTDSGITTGGNFSEEKGVNIPKLASNMRLVTFNEENNTWIEDATQNAYSYVDTSVPENENKSEWANAEVTVDGITSYFVWIPRYAYKITYYTNENKTEISDTPTAYGTIDVKFIKGTGNIAADGVTVCKYASENPDVTKDYVVHPAFTADVDQGGWSKELSGIWIGKFEASLANKADGSNIVTDSEITGDILLSDNTDKTVVTKPGYSSWRYITIGNMYTNALAYDTNLESHMLKNSEWGAVAYLTESKYGRNGTEVTQNTAEGYITGGGEERVYATTNTNQSSTGNVYGIYDLSGGAYEYVASYKKNEDFSDEGTNFTNNTSDAYSTIYDTDNIATGYKYGDATYETRLWHSDNASFGSSDMPYFVRSGSKSIDENYAGIFYFYNGNGKGIKGNSFRLTLII